MKQLDLRGRILLAIGAGGLAAAACGGENMSEATTGSDAARDAPSSMTEDGHPAQGGGGSGGAIAGDASSGAGGSSAAGSGGTSIATEAGREAQAGASGRDAARDAPSVDVVDAPLDTVADRVVYDACRTYGESCTQPGDCCNDVPCRMTPVGSMCFISVRRPFLVGSSLRVATAVERGDWQPDDKIVAVPVDLDAATAEALARDWLQDACEEHASIAAFARFTMHLVSVGAPPEMIVASQLAAIDEVKHARACFALARRYGGRTMGPSALSLDGAMEPMTLAEIAALSAEEGCVGETLGVLLAEEQLRRTTDPLVRSLLVRATIVADEGRHAELAWTFVRWAIAQGGEPVRRTVAAAIRRAIDSTLTMPIRSYDAIDVEAWRAHGRLTCADAHAVAERGVREIVEPCAAVLLGRPLPKTAVRQPSIASCA
jgi:hypothetical protein